MQSSKTTDKSQKQNEQLHQYKMDTDRKFRGTPFVRRNSQSEPDLTEQKRPDTPKPFPKRSHEL